MPGETPRRTGRLEARVDADVLEAIKRAAKLSRVSVSEFVTSAAWKAARRALRRRRLIRLEAEAQARFVEALLNPPEPAPALRAAREAHARIVRGSR